MVHQNSEVHPIDVATGVPMDDAQFDKWVDEGRPPHWVQNPMQAAAAAQTAGDLWAFDPGVFYNYSSMVYPVHPTPTVAGAAGLLETNEQQYKYMVQMATSIIATMQDRGEDLPSWYGTGAGYVGDVDVFGYGLDLHTLDEATREAFFAQPPDNVLRFMAWWDGVKDNDLWTPTLASAAHRMASETDTALKYIEVGAPGHRDHRIFDYNNVLRLIQKYGVDFLDLSGPHGYGLLETAATQDMQLDPLFDIATSALERHRDTRTVSTDQETNVAAQRAALASAVRKYSFYIERGHNHVQAKIFTFGGEQLGNRVMGIGDGTAESDLTGEEMGQIISILGPDWQQELAGMDAFDAQDQIGSFRFAGYMDDLASRGPVEVQGDAMREAARTLAQGWRLQPLSDNELDSMVMEFGAKLRESRMMPPVWDNVLGGGGGMPGAASPGLVPASAPSGITEVPNMNVEALGAVRGTADYQRLYGNKPTDMGEEEWISRFAGASQSLTGMESRMATETGMESGDMTRARQVALSDESARGGAWYRRMAAWRKAFQ